MGCAKANEGCTDNKITRRFGFEVLSTKASSEQKYEEKGDFQKHALIIPFEPRIWKHGKHLKCWHAYVDLIQKSGRSYISL